MDTKKSFTPPYLKEQEAYLKEMLVKEKDSEDKTNQAEKRSKRLLRVGILPSAKKECGVTHHNQNCGIYLWY